MEVTLDLGIRKDGLLDWQREEKLKMLRHYYANALVTYAQCGGHNKAFYNEQAFKKWRKEIRKFGGKVPSNKEAYRWGIFNGEGSA